MRNIQCGYGSDLLQEYFRHGRMMAGRKDGLKPYDPTCVYRYDVQDMLVREVGMNDETPCETFGYNDRVISWYGVEKYNAVFERFQDSGGGGMEAFVNRMTEERFLEFGQAIVDLADMDKKISGFRVVRYTNHASGYPCYRFDVVWSVPERNDGSG